MHECQLEMPLVGCALQAGTIGQHYLCILITISITVYHDTVEHTRLSILMMDIQIITRNLTVKNTLGNLQLGRLLFHTPHKCGQLLGGLRTYLVLEIKTSQADKQGQDENRLQDTYQRNTACLHGQQLKALTHIAK